MQGLFTFIYNNMDHGSSVHFTITKTGVDGEIMAIIHPGKSSDNETWIPPMIFKHHHKVMEEKFLEEFKNSGFKKSMDLFQNKDTFMSAVDAFQIIIGAMNKGLNRPRKGVKWREILALGNAAFRLKDWALALEHYQNLHQIRPDEKTNARIQMCIAYIARENRIEQNTIHEEETDPFEGEEEDGFGKEK